jgi:hypothetical protein
MPLSENWSPSFGVSAECGLFYDRNQKFFERLDALNQTMRNILVRTFQVDSTDKEIVHFLGRLTIEDFMEILLLSGNGYGIGALKILRGQYERTVTAAYVAKNSETAGRFVRFGNVQYRRMLNQAKQIYGEQRLRGMLSPGRIEKIETAYNGVKDEFKESLCEKCDTTRMAFSWSALDATLDQANEGSVQPSGFCQPLSRTGANLVPGEEDPNQG